MNKTPILCCCGRNPEVGADLRGYRYSLTCKCGTNEINFAAWSDNVDRVLENWESLINDTPPRNFVQHLSTLDAIMQLPVMVGGDDYDTDPLRRYIRRTGGHCSGGAGCC